MKLKVIICVVLLSMVLGVSAKTLVYRDVFDKADPLDEAKIMNGDPFMDFFGPKALGWSFWEKQNVTTSLKMRYKALYCSKSNTFPSKQAHASKYIYFDPNHDFTINLSVSWDEWYDITQDYEKRYSYQEEDYSEDWESDDSYYQGPGRSIDKALMAGLLWGAKDEYGDPYYLGINYNGDYMLYRTSDAGGDSDQSNGYGPYDKLLTPLLEGKPKVSGLSEDKLWFKLSISKTKDNITISIDDKVVQTLPAMPNLGSCVGLMMEGAQNTIFTNLEVWQDDDFTREIPTFRASKDYIFSTSVPSAWDHQNSNNQTYSFSPLGMMVETGADTKTKTYSGKVPYKVYSIDDYMIELTTFCYSDAMDDQQGFGIQWGNGQQDLKNHFLINPRGYYNISYDWRPSHHINLRRDGYLRVSAINTLAVAKVGNRFYFMINGNIVADYPSESYNSFSFGIYQGKNLKVEYSRITINHNSNRPDFAVDSVIHKSFNALDPIFKIENPKKNKFSYTDNGLECNTLDVKKESYVMAPIANIGTSAFSCYVNVTFDDVPQTGATGLFIGDPKGLVHYLGVDKGRQWHKRRLELGKNQRHGAYGNLTGGKGLTYTLGLETRGRAVYFYVDGVTVESYDFLPIDKVVIGILAEDKVKATFTDWKVYQAPILSPSSLPLLYNEQFTSDTIYQNKEKTSSFSAHLDAGDMIIDKTSADGGNGIFASCELDFSKDYIIEGGFQWTSGVDDSVYGMMFAFKDWDNYVSLGVSADGAYRLSQEIDNRYLQLIPWRNNDVVAKYGYNKIAVWKKDKAYYVYINDVLVDFCSSGDEEGNMFGYYVQGKQSFRVDWLKIYGTKKVE